MNKKGYLVVLALLVTLGVLVLFGKPIVKAAGGVFALLNVASTPLNSDGGIIATSTLNYLSPGAGTTTVTVRTEGTEQLRVNIFMLSSTTVTTEPTDLRWTVEFSHSTTSVAASQVWFPEPAVLISNATTSILTGLAKEYMWQFASSTRHQIATSTATINQFDPARTAALSFELEDIAARWTRIVFYIPSPGNTLAESTALSRLPTATSSNAGIQVFVTQKEPF